MKILVLILGAVLLSKACALKCYQCIPDISGSCTQTTECPSNTLCGSITVTTYEGGSGSSFAIRNCTTADQCINGSVNFGLGDTVISTTCCSSDLCNSQNAPVGSIPSPNGKMCFQCQGQVCNKTLNCTGDENYCISANVTVGGAAVIEKGCASKQVCSSLQSVQMTGVTAAKISCCQGNLCNSAISTTAGLLLLVAPLISLIWIS